MGDNDVYDGDTSSVASALVPPPMKSYLTRCCCCTPVRRFSSIKRCEWAFIVASLLAIVLSLYFSIKDLTEVEYGSDDFVIGCVILFTTVMCGFYTVHGILAKSQPAEFFAYAICLTGYCAYSIASYAYNKGDPDDRGRFIASLVLVIVCLLSGGYALWKYKSWRRIVYYISCRSDQQRMLNICFLCKSLIVVTFQYEVSMVIFAIDYRFRTEWMEIAALVLAGLVAIVWIVCGLHGMMQEIKAEIVAFFVCSVYLIAYDLYRLVDVLLKMPPKLYIVTVSVCAIISLLLTIVVMILMKMAWNNFGQDVKDLLRLVPPSECKRLQTINHDGASGYSTMTDTKHNSI